MLSTVCDDCESNIKRALPQQQDAPAVAERLCCCIVSSVSRESRLAHLGATLVSRLFVNYLLLLDVLLHRGVNYAHGKKEVVSTH